MTQRIGTQNGKYCVVCNENNKCWQNWNKQFLLFQAHSWHYTCKHIGVYMAMLETLHTFLNLGINYKSPFKIIFKMSIASS